ncbi:CLUMA_CG020763, isoform A [Clunio marinus]|uniref:CLUMA_CG020763, isoform A n=1 Tax=Clunio marinus TaxID=568069 RepID=A0A1J1J9V9_9DIPT|nr:CLUMA_CG020763, isoform A [Clunio marinus]
MDKERSETVLAVKWYGREKATLKDVTQQIKQLTCNDFKTSTRKRNAQMKQKKNEENEENEENITNSTGIKKVSKHSTLAQFVEFPQAFVEWSEEILISLLYFHTFTT